MTDKQESVKASGVAVAGSQRVSAGQAAGSKATATPWRIEPRDLDPHEQQHEGRVRIGSTNEDGEGGGNGGIYVAHTLGPDRVGNALKIVRAVNSHDTLIEALKAAKREMWDMARYSWTLSDFKNWAVVQQIDAALRDARPSPSTVPVERA